MAADTSVQSISVALHLKTSELVKNAQAAKTQAQGVLQSGLSLRVQLREPSAASVERVRKKVETSLNQNLQKAMVLEPKFTVKPASVKTLKEDIERQIGKQYIIGLRWNKNDLVSLKPDIMRAVGIIDIPLTYHWKDGPPDLSGAAGGPTGTPSGTPSGDGKADATAREAERKATAAEKRAADARAKAAAAEEAAAKAAEASAKTKTKTKTETKAKAEPKTATATEAPEPNYLKNMSGADLREHVAETKGTAREAAFQGEIDRRAAQEPFRPPAKQSLSGQKPPKPRKEPKTKPATGAAPPDTAQTAPSTTPRGEQPLTEAEMIELAKVYEHDTFVRNVQPERDRGVGGARLAAPLPKTINPQRAAYAEMMAQTQREKLAGIRKAGGGGAGYKRGVEINRGLTVARTDPQAGVDIIAQALTYGRNDPDLAMDTAISYVDAQTAFLGGDTGKAVARSRTGEKAMRALNPRMFKRFRKAEDPKRGKPIEYTDFKTGEVKESGLEDVITLSGLTRSYARQLKIENDANAAIQKGAGKGIAGTRRGRGNVEGGDMGRLWEQLSDQFKGEIDPAELEAQRQLFMVSGGQFARISTDISENEPAPVKVPTPITAEQKRSDKAVQRAKRAPSVPETLGLTPAGLALQKAGKPVPASEYLSTASAKPGGFVPEGAEQANVTARLNRERAAAANQRQEEQQEAFMKKARAQARGKRKEFKELGQLAGPVTTGSYFGHALQAGAVEDIFSAEVRAALPYRTLLDLLGGVEGKAGGGPVSSAFPGISVSGGGIQLGGPSGLLQALLMATLLPDGRTVKPGHEAEAKRLNQLIEQQRGGWQGRAGGGPVGSLRAGMHIDHGELGELLIDSISDTGMVRLRKATDPEGLTWKAAKSFDEMEAGRGTKWEPKSLLRGSLLRKLEGRRAGGRVEFDPTKDPRHSRAWAKVSQQVRQEEPNCRYCGMPSQQTDHMVPFNRGGDWWDRANLAGACQSCNQAKGNMTATEFVLKRGFGKAGGGRTGTGLYRVGEGGKEFFHSASGLADQWLVGDQIWQAPEDGYITPAFKIDPQLRNAVPGHARGGRVKGYGGRFAAQPGSGLAGRKEYREAFPGERMMVAEGKLSPAGGVQRVFVVNWPPAPSAGGFVHAETRTRRPRRTLEPDDEGEPETGAEGATGGGTGKGTTKPKAKRGARTAEEKAADYQVKRDIAEEFQDRLIEARAGISESLQLVPVRALSVSAGQILQTKFGGRAEILKRAKYAEAQVNDAQKDVNELQRRKQDLDDAQRQLEYTETAFGPTSTEAEEARGEKDIREQLFAKQQRAADISTAYSRIQGQVGGLPELRKDITRQGKAGLIDAEEELRQQKVLDLAEQKIEEDQKAGRPVRKTGVLTSGEQARTQAVGLVGIIGGTLLFTAAMQGAQLGLQVLGMVTSKAVDAMQGFSLTAVKVSADLAEASRTVPGRPAAGIQQRLAQLGVSPEAMGRLAPTIAAGSNLAAAQNMQQLVDIQRANSFYTRGGPVPGLGGDLRNGLFGSTLGQTPSIAEQMAGELSRLAVRQIPMSQATPGQQAEWAKLPFMDQLSRQFNAVMGGENLFDLNGIAGLPGINRTTTPTVLGSVFAKDPEAQAAYLKEINTYVERGARSSGAIAETLVDLTDSNQSLKQATIDAFDAAGRKDLGEQLTAAGVVLQGREGKAPDVFSANRFLAQYGLGGQIPNAQSAYQAQLPGLAMQQAANNLRADFTRDRELPLQFGWQQFMNRPLAPGIGVPGGGALPQTGQFQQRMAQLAAPGIAHIQAEVDPEIFRELDDLSAEIKSLNERQIKINVDFQEEQFQSQLKLAVRSGGDLLGLAGRQSQYVHGQLVDVTQMGKLQREQLEIGRAQTELELKRSQRQINFGLAQAQINVPGATPAEMASFLADAQLQASEAQKQLDLQKRGFKVGTQIEDISISRQAQDFIDITLPQMLEGHEIQIESTKLNEAVTAAQALQGWLGAVGETYTTTVLTNEKLVRDTQIEISLAAATWVTELEAAGLAYENIHRAQLGIPLIPTGFNGGTSSSGGFGTTPTNTTFPHAAGIVGMTNGITNLGYAGEAGGELYAVLKNPRPFDPGGWMGSGGGVSVQINFNGISVRDDSDIDRLARKVEDVMNRRALSIGLG